MPHVSLKYILTDAQRRHYGVPNLWGGNLEKVIGYIRAAEKVQSPVCICYNRGLCPDIPIEINMPLIVQAARYASVPVTTILDHGEDFDEVKKAIHFGASSVMFDGSQLPYEENVNKTKQIADYAHSRNVDVEAELGAVGGSAIESGGYSDVVSIYTDPEQARDFVNRTNIDALAISFGNVHGKYRGKPKLNLDLVRNIASMVDIPLVMHGASGLNKSDYADVIDSGISKINYYTTMGLSSAENIRRKTATAGEDLVCHKIVKWNIDFITKETEDLFILLRGAGKVPTMPNWNDSTVDEKSILPLHQNDFEDKKFIEVVSNVIIEELRKNKI